MNNTNILESLGLCFLIIIMGIIVIIIYTILKDCSKKVIKKWKIKHRFNKKPIAKCYCIDCENLNTMCGENVLKCYKSGLEVKDNDFCSKGKVNRFSNRITTTITRT